VCLNTKILKIKNEMKITMFPYKKICGSFSGIEQMKCVSQIFFHQITDCFVKRRLHFSFPELQPEPNFHHVLKLPGAFFTLTGQKETSCGNLLKKIYLKKKIAKEKHTLYILKKENA